MLIRIAALALSLASPALAENIQNRADLVRALCQPTGCDEVAVVGVERIASSPEGTLFRTRAEMFHASSAGRKATGTDEGYVFCSPSKPAVLADQNGQTVAFLLAPFSTQDSRETIRKNANFHALYFTACHGLEAGRAAVHNVTGVASAHGYDVPLARARLVTLAKPGDILGGGAAGTRVETREEHREPPLRPVPHAPAVAEGDGLISGARRLTSRAFDALDEVGGWLGLGGRR
jgi:hypothetical protein